MKPVQQYCDKLIDSSNAIDVATDQDVSKITTCDKVKSKQKVENKTNSREVYQEGKWNNNGNEIIPSPTGMRVWKQTQSGEFVQINKKES